MRGPLEFLAAVPSQQAFFTKTLPLNNSRCSTFCMRRRLSWHRTQCDVLEAAESCHVAGSGFPVHFIQPCTAGLDAEIQYDPDYRPAIIYCRLRTTVIPRQPGCSWLRTDGAFNRYIVHDNRSFCHCCMIRSPVYRLHDMTPRDSALRPTGMT